MVICYMSYFRCPGKYCICSKVPRALLLAESYACHYHVCRAIFCMLLVCRIFCMMQLLICRL